MDEIHEISLFSAPLTPFPWIACRSLALVSPPSLALPVGVLFSCHPPPPQSLALPVGFSLSCSSQFSPNFCLRLCEEDTRCDKLHVNKIITVMRHSLTQRSYECAHKKLSKTGELFANGSLPWATAIPQPAHLKFCWAMTNFRLKIE